MGRGRRQTGFTTTTTLQPTHKQQGPVATSVLSKRPFLDLVRYVFAKKCSYRCVQSARIRTSSVPDRWRYAMICIGNNSHFNRSIHSTFTTTNWINIHININNLLQHLLGSRIRLHALRSKQCPCQLEGRRQNILKQLK